MNKKQIIIISGLGLFFILAITSTLSVWYLLKQPKSESDSEKETISSQTSSSKKILVNSDITFETFNSNKELVTYLSNNDSEQLKYMNEMPLESIEPVGYTNDSTTIRHSTTNVQVSGIDEPDILKTNGKNIFYSPQNYDVYYDYQPMVLESGEMADIAPYDPPENKTVITNTLTDNSLQQIATISETGDLLLIDNVLIVLEYQSVTAYDITNATNPKQLWTYELTPDVYVQDARVLDGKLYLITNQQIYNYNEESICPLKPMTNQTDISIPCNEIYYNVNNTSSDTIYTIFKFDPENGSIKDKTSVLASYDTNLYVNANSIYLLYANQNDQTNIMLNFLFDQSQELFPTEIAERILYLKDLKISDQSKTTEIYLILDDFQNTLTQDERNDFEKKLNDGMTNYFNKNKELFVNSTLVKFSTTDFTNVQTKLIPGYVLNSFSIDEYNEVLRIAVTFPNDIVTDANVSSIYTFDSNLEMLGNVSDLGQGEDIYAVRFVDELAYVVTFKQIDPFYIVDISDPKKPITTGELKIPGYSSYLHPISENIILGIGEEGSQVKLSLFDVSDNSNPKEISKTILDEYWSDVSESHHAFLQDPDNEVFFLPAGGNEYIYSYKDNKLTQKYKGNDFDSKRAVYVGQYLYIAGDTSIKVIDEKTWTEVTSLNLYSF